MIPRASRHTDLAGRLKASAVSWGRAIKSFFAFSPAHERVAMRKRLAISLDWDALHVAHGARFLCRMTVKGYKTYRFQEGKYPSPETVAATAALYAAEAGLAHPPVLLCLPKAWSIVRTTALPIAAKENLAEALSYELDRITPFDADAAYYDFRVLEEGQGKLTLAVAASKKEAVDPYLRALAGRGLSVDRIDLNLSAVAACLDYLYPDQDLVYLDIGAASYEGGRMQSGVLTAGYAGSFNGNGGDAAALVDLAEEMKPLAGFGPAGALPRVLVRLQNGVQREPLEKQFQAPVSVLNDGDVALPGIEGEKAKKRIPPAAVGGVVAGLRRKAKAYNLLRRGRSPADRMPWALTTVLVAVLLTMSALALALPLHKEKQRVAAIEQEIAARKEAVQRIEALRKEEQALASEVRMLAGFKEGKPLPVDILKELTAILPKSAWLTRLRITETGVDAEGYAASATDILSRIEASPYFMKVEFASPTMRDARANVDRFLLRMEIEGARPLEPTGAHGKKQ